MKRGRMDRQVILVTGTPCVGKTVVCSKLVTELDALYINLTELAESERLKLGTDKERATAIIDETKMRRRLREIIEETDRIAVVVDGHYAAAVVPKKLVTRIFVLRRNPVELRGFMEKSGFQGSKLWENLASEILDVCLVEALREHKGEKVCELDVTGKKVESVVAEILGVMNLRQACQVGCVDWLGLLEKAGVLDEYLRV
jgi:adenylate kinase